MRHLCSFLRLLIVTAVLGLATLGGAKPAAAAVEFRYGQLSWRKISPVTAEFTLTCGFRRSAYAGRSRDGFVGVGDRFTDAPLGIVLNFDDDAAPDPANPTVPATPLKPKFTPAGGLSGTGLEFVAVAVDPVRDVVIARAIDPDTDRDRIQFTYPTPLDLDGTDGLGGGVPWVASIGINSNGAQGTGFSRPFTLRNNPGGTFRVEADVDLSANDQSAVTSMPTFLNVPQGGGSFFVPGFDADQHTLRYRLAGFSEAGNGFFNPPGATIDPITGEYTVPPSLTPGSWATQVVVEEYGSGALPIGKVSVDFVFTVGFATVGAAPVFATPPTPANGALITAVVGRPLSYLVQAGDPDGDVVTINSTGIPTGARHVASLPTSGTSAQSLLSWTPTQASLGAYSIVYTAEDSSGNMSQSSLTIIVVQGIDLLEPDGGEMYTVNQLVDIRWDSGGGVRQAGVKIEISRDGGVNWDPTPIAALTGDTGSYLWTVTGPFTKTGRIRVSNAADPADFGISAADFTIADGRRVGPICSTVGSTPITDNEPSWTEVPINFTDDLIIRSLDVRVDITHPFIGDLEIAVVHPDGTAILLHDETGEGIANLNETYGYGYRNGVKLVVPVEALTALYGKRSNGVWKLRVRDLNPGDVGSVDSWCLSMVGRDTGKITVTSPAAGDRWAVATTHPLTWTQVGVVGDVNVQTSRDSGVTWTTVATVPVDDLSFNWLVSGPETTHARVRVVSVEDPVQVDDTDGDFIIQNPYFRMLLPAGGESIPVGRPFQIRWDGVPLGAGEDVKIEYSEDSGANWITLAGAASNTGLFTWTPTVDQVSDTARIRISSNQAPSRIAQTPDFKVQQPTLAILAPVSGDTWYIETTHTIRWSTVGITGSVNVELSRNNGISWELLAVNADNTQAEGSIDWKVTGPATVDLDKAKIRVTSVSNPSQFGLSDAFTIKEMRVKVTSPNGGEVFGSGSTQTITWDPQDIIGTVDISLIELNPGTGERHTALFTDVPNGGSATWVVGSGAPNSKWLIRVKAHDYLAADESDAVFTIITPVLSVVAPAGGEELRVGSATTLKWASEGVPGRVRLELSRDGGSTWETLFASTTNDGTEQWNPVTGPDTANAVLRVTSLDSPSVTAQSASAFSIVTPAITITAPNGGQRWFTGTVQSIIWSGKGFDGGVRIELTRDGGTNWETLFDRTDNDGLQEWVVSGANASNARIRVTAVTQPGITDQSDGPFSIVTPSITIGAPNGGQTWLLGTTQTVTWHTVGVTGGIDIELSLDNGSTWAPLKTNVADDGSEAWSVEGAVSTSARIRVTSHSRTEITDTSDSAFTIAVATLQVTSPSSTSIWHKGSRETITWAGPALSAGGTVDILLSRNGGKTYKAIIEDTANDGSATWLVTGATAKKCKVKVVWKNQDGVSGISNGNFAIAGKLKVKKNR